MDNLLLFWIECLQLKDWTIELTTDVYEMPNGDKDCGQVQYSEAGKAAHIYIMHPDLYGDRVVPFDPEKTLVHELLHIKMCLLDCREDDNLQSRVLHQLIDDLAKALVKARREKHRHTADGSLSLKARR